ncbi:MAG: SWIM zinc finger family protein [Candidatus Helarchaeota archaeon]
MRLNDVEKELESGLLNLNEAKLRAISLERDYERGIQYYYSNSVTKTVLVPPGLLKSRVYGNYKPYYNVEIRAKEEKLEWYCTCPVGGLCKHIKATLLMWIKKPNRFVIKEGQGTTQMEIIDVRIINNDIKNVLSRYNREDIIEKLILITEKTGLINNFHDIIEILDYPREFTEKVIRYTDKLKKIVESELENLVNNYSELERYYEDNGYYEDYYEYNYRKRDMDFISEEESELLTNISEIMKKMNEMKTRKKKYQNYKIAGKTSVIIENRQKRAWVKKSKYKIEFVFKLNQKINFRKFQYPFFCTAR